VWGNLVRHIGIWEEAMRRRSFTFVVIVAAGGGSTIVSDPVGSLIQVG
jgi:hypothetical protein